MARKSHRNKNKSGRDRMRPSQQLPRRVATSPLPPPPVDDDIDPEQLELMKGALEAVEGSDPLTLLTLISGVAAAADRRPAGHAADEDQLGMTYDELIASFLEVRIPATSVLLAVVAATHPDELLRARIRRELVVRRHPVPGWLRALEFTVTGIEQMSEPLGDADEFFIGFRTGSRHESTFIVLVDHHSGTVVKDAFISGQPISELISYIKSSHGSKGLAFSPVDRADVRAKLTESIETGALIYPPHESETWPQLRPLLEWVIATLPTGGESWKRPEWTDDDRARLIDDFFDSVFGLALDDADHRDLLDTLLWFGIDYGPGNPLRWSPTGVEILLFDWIPRKIVAPADYLDKATGLLRAFISFVHDYDGVPLHLTAETLGAVDAYLPEYEQLIRAPRHQGPMALLERIGAIAPLKGDDVDWLDGFDEADEESLPTFMLDSIARAVGDRDALNRLDATPLPDEKFAWDDISGDIHTRVADVLARLDEVGGTLGTEYRTVCRRLLHDVAVGDPQIFRRRSSPARTAATIAWMITKANELFGYSRLMTAEDLLDKFGVKGSVAERSQVMQKAIGINPHRQYGGMNLYSPAFLVSSRREELIKLRDRYLGQITAP